MKNEIHATANNFQLLSNPQPTFTNSGDNGIQVANQQGGTINMYLSANLPINSGVVYNAATAINTNLYNLFVVDNEDFNDPFFYIGKDCALTISEGISYDISARYAALTPESIMEIKTFPSIFATKNRYYVRTDIDHLAYYGLVTNIAVKESNIKVYYQKFCSFPQQRLNEIASKLDIQCASMINELGRTHWTIKRINLIEELRVSGINITIPA